MDLNCEKCSQKYHIPESKLEEKSVFFFCEKCGHKIVISRRHENWFDESGFGDPPYRPGLLTEGVRNSFNFKGIAISFSVLYSMFIFLGLAGYLIYKNAVFFAGHPLFSGITAFIVFISVSYVYDFLLYLISLNAFSRFEKHENIKFGFIAQEIAADASKIFVFSSLGVIVLFLLSLPVYPLRSAGPVYTAILFPALYAGAVFVVLTAFTRGMLYSLIAFRRRNLKMTFKTIFRFIAVENFNIAAFSVIANALTAAGGLIAFTAAYLPAALVIAVSGLFYNPEGAVSLKDVISGVSGAGAQDIEAAVFILVFFLSIVTVLILSWLTVLRQNLYAASVIIMESNPGRAISGRSLIIAVISVIVLIWLAIAVKAG